MADKKNNTTNTTTTKENVKSTKSTEKVKNIEPVKEQSDDVDVNLDSAKKEDISEKTLQEQENLVNAKIELQEEELNLEKEKIKSLESLIKVRKKIREYEKEKIKNAEKVQQLQLAAIKATGDEKIKIQEQIKNYGNLYKIIEEKQKNELDNYKALLENKKGLSTLLAGAGKAKEKASGFLEKTFGLKTNSLFSFIVSAIAAGMSAAQAAVKRRNEKLLVTYKQNEDLVTRMADGIVKAHGSSLKDAVSEEADFIHKARFEALKWGDKAAKGGELYIEIAKSIRGGGEMQPEVLAEGVKQVYLWTNKLSANKSDILDVIKSLTSTFTMKMPEIKEELWGMDSVFSEFNKQMKKQAWNFNDLWRHVNKARKGLEGYGYSLTHIASLLANNAKHAQSMGAGMKFAGDYADKMNDILLKGDVPKWMKYMTGREIIDDTFGDYFDILSKFKKGKTTKDVVDKTLLGVLKKMGMEGSDVDDVKKLGGMSKMLGKAIQDIGEGKLGRYSGSMLISEIVRGTKEGSKIMYGLMKNKLNAGQDTIALLKQQMGLTWKQAHMLNEELKSGDREEFVKKLEAYKEENKPLNVHNHRKNVYGAMNKAVNLKEHGILGELRKLVFGLLEKIPSILQSIWDVAKNIYKFFAGDKSGKEKARAEAKIREDLIIQMEDMQKSERYREIQAKKEKGEKLSYTDKEYMKQYGDIREKITADMENMGDYKKTAGVKKVYDRIKEFREEGVKRKQEAQYIRKKTRVDKKIEDASKKGIKENNKKIKKINVLQEKMKLDNKLMKKIKLSDIQKELPDLLTMVAKEKHGMDLAKYDKKVINKMLQKYQLSKKELLEMGENMYQTLGIDKKGKMLNFKRYTDTQVFIKDWLKDEILPTTKAHSEFMEYLGNMIIHNRQDDLHSAYQRGFTPENLMSAKKTGNFEGILSSNLSKGEYQTYSNVAKDAFTYAKSALFGDGNLNIKKDIDGNFSAVIETVNKEIPLAGFSIALDNRIGKMIHKSNFNKVETK